MEDIFLIIQLLSLGAFVCDIYTPKKCYKNIVIMGDDYDIIMERTFLIMSMMFLLSLTSFIVKETLFVIHVFLKMSLS